MACKKLSVGMLVMILELGANDRTFSVVPVITTYCSNSQNDVTFWYRFTKVVLE